MLSATGRLAFACCFAALAFVSIAETNGTSSFPANATNNGSVDCAAGLSEKKKTVEGFVAVVVAVLFFGSNFVPVKKFDTGDGMFFQWVMCTGIWLVALVTQLVLRFHPDNDNNLNRTTSVPFQPEALVGGFLWTTGNLFCVPVIKCIGLGLGMLIWGTLNCVGGWASGRFGILGVKASLPGSEAKNFSGVALCVVGVIMFLFVKSAGKKSKLEEESPGERARLISSKQIQDSNVARLKSHHPPPSPTTRKEDLDDSWVDRMNPKTKKIAGSLMAVAAGLLFGVSFNPVTHLEQSDCHNPQNGLDYAFSHFSGILLTSTFYFLIYCIIKKNKPQVIGQAVLPGLVAGIMWAIAYGAWLIANTNLTQTISYPMVSTLPGLVSALLGIFVFAEIRGAKNLTFFGLACCFIVGGSVLTALSKN